MDDDRRIYHVGGEPACYCCKNPLEANNMINWSLWLPKNNISFKLCRNCYHGGEVFCAKWMVMNEINRKNKLKGE